LDMIQNQFIIMSNYKISLFYVQILMKIILLF